VTRIALYTLGRVFHYGKVWASYTRSRSAPLIVDDTYSHRTV
jgi:hypothetical protein